MRGLSNEDKHKDIPRKSGNGQSAWFSSISTSMNPSGRQSNQYQPNLDALQKPYNAGCGNPEIDQGNRGGISTNEPDCLKELEREKRELKRANEILPTAPVFSPRRVRPAAAAARTEVMVRYIDAHRDCYGVEPICKQLPIAEDGLGPGCFGAGALV